MMHSEIFADESSQNNHRYLVLGALVLEKADTPKVEAKFRELRERYKLNKEMKWARVSTYHSAAYTAMFDAFVDFLRNDTIHAHTLVVDTATFNHNKHNGGDREIGFSKLIYQLLLHKFGRKYGSNYRFEAYLDARETKQDPEEMRAMLNSALARDYKIGTEPFRFIVFRDSKSSDIMQLCDVLIGAIAYRANRHYLEPNASKAKCGMAEHMMRALVNLEAPVRPSRAAAIRFTYWRFRYAG